MFDIGWTEILVIAVVAVIVVGPKDLPRMLRSLGRYAGQLKRTASEFRTQFDEAVQDSELQELRNTLNDASDLNPVNQIKDSVTESLKPLEETAQDIKGEIEKPTEDESEKPIEGAEIDDPGAEAVDEPESVPPEVTEATPDEKEVAKSGGQAT